MFPFSTPSLLENRRQYEQDSACQYTFYIAAQIKVKIGWKTSSEYLSLLPFSALVNFSPRCTQNWMQENLQIFTCQRWLFSVFRHPHIRPLGQIGNPTARTEYLITQRLYRVCLLQSKTKAQKTVLFPLCSNFFMFAGEYLPQQHNNYTLCLIQSHEAYAKEFEQLRCNLEDLYHVPGTRPRRYLGKIIYVTYIINPIQCEILPEHRCLGESFVLSVSVPGP